MNDFITMRTNNTEYLVKYEEINGREVTIIIDLNIDGCMSVTNAIEDLSTAHKAQHIIYQDSMKMFSYWNILEGFKPLAIDGRSTSDLESAILIAKNKYINDEHIYEVKFFDALSIINASEGQFPTTEEIVKEIQRQRRPLIKLNKADISVQAGALNYSIPRRYLEDIQKYKSVEIALFSKDGEWINPHKSNLLDLFPRKEELLSYYEGDEEKEREMVVAGYVSIDLVNELIEYLKGDDE